MDNFRIDVSAEGRESLKAALSIAIAGNGGHGGIDGYVVTAEHGLVFVSGARRAAGAGVSVLPFGLDAEGAGDFAMRYLAEARYGPTPDHDGDDQKAWRVHVGEWGRIAEVDGAVCAVQPIWAMYGK